jgi:hypothetical protein
MISALDQIWCHGTSHRAPAQCPACADRVVQVGPPCSGRRQHGVLTRRADRERRMLAGSDGRGFLSETIELSHGKGYAGGCVVEWITGNALRGV